MDELMKLAIQAGPAAAVCGMFLIFLLYLRKLEDAAKKEFLSHLEIKDKQHTESVDKQMSYLRERDAQSKEIAMNGHDALREVGHEVARLREDLSRERNANRSS